MNTTHGAAEALAMETRPAMPIEDKVAMLLAAVVQKMGILIWHKIRAEDRSDEWGASW